MFARDELLLVSTGICLYNVFLILSTAETDEKQESVFFLGSAADVSEVNTSLHEV